GCGEDEILGPPQIGIGGTITIGSLLIQTNYDTTLMVRNLGEDRLTIQSFSVNDAELIQINLETPKSIEAGDSLAVSIRIRANNSGRFTDTVTINTNDDANPTVEVPVVITTLSYEKVQSGWTKFSAADFAGAITDFNDAVGLDANYGEAYTGQGWTRLKQDQLAPAITSFTNALAHGGGNDAHAGKAFAELNSQNHANAVTDVDAVVTITGTTASSYTFSHDNTITQTDLLWVKARAHFLLGQYAQAQTVVNVLAPSNTLNPGSPTYQQDLAALIESLRGTV
ncbi:hypothetical protein K1X84_10160, partial [bacterium]|nr:hypothetical protein [bacterium]